VHRAAREITATAQSASDRFDKQPKRTHEGKPVLDVVPFTVQTVDLGQSRHVMNLRGDLDIAAADQAWEQVNELLKPGALVILDVSRLGLMDSSGLRFLLLARREAEARGATLALLRPRPWLRERLRVGGVLDLFDLHFELSSALRSAGAAAATTEATAN
jgi:anti-sigma B factor antagonist